MSRTTRPVGELVREWREQRRLSQLALALDAGVSTRHLSFLETGKARPSREMVERLAERLDVPLRERNTLLLAAGFAPAYPEHRLDDPALDTADWREDGPGNLRTHYVLPAAALRVLGAGVVWPLPADPLAEAAEATGPHRLVWVDLDR